MTLNWMKINDFCTYNCVHLFVIVKSCPRFRSTQNLHKQFFIRTYRWQIIQIAIDISPLFLHHTLFPFVLFLLTRTHFSHTTLTFYTQNHLYHSLSCCALIADILSRFLRSDLFHLARIPCYGVFFVRQ